MREVGRGARGSRTRGGRRALQLAACVSLLVLGCSVYDTSLLSGRGGLSATDAGADGGASSLFDAGGGGLPSDGGRSGKAGEENQAYAGDSSGAGTSGVEAGAGEAGATMQETGGSGVIVTYGGASGSGGRAGDGGAPAAGGAGPSSAGAAGNPPVLKELAKSKKATASSVQTGNDIAEGNDGDSSTRWCAVSPAMPQWWRVDLGAGHELTQVVIKFEHPQRKYTYVIETSLDDSVYMQRATVNGTGDAQTVDMPPGVSARYLRVTVTAASPFTDANGGVYPTWASFWELRLYGY